MVRCDNPKHESREYYDECLTKENQEIFEFLNGASYHIHQQQNVLKKHQRYEERLELPRAFRSIFCKV